MTTETKTVVPEVVGTAKANEKTEKTVSAPIATPAVKAAAQPPAPKVVSRFATLEEAGSYFRGLAAKSAAQTVVLYWELGKEVQALKDGSRYKASVADLAASINIDFLSERELRKCCVFYRRVPQADLNKMIGQGKIGWGNVAEALKVHDPEKSKQLMLQAAEQSMTKSEVVEKVQEINQVERKETGKEKRPTHARPDNIVVPLKKVESLMKKLGHMYDDVRACVDRSSSVLKNDTPEESAYLEALATLKETSTDFLEKTELFKQEINRS